MKRSAVSLGVGAMVGMGVVVLMLSVQGANASAPFSKADCPAGQDILVSIPEYRLPLPGADLSEAGSINAARASLVSAGAAVAKIQAGKTFREAGRSRKPVTFTDRNGRRVAETTVAEFSPGMWRPTAYSFCAPVR